MSDVSNLEVAFVYSLPYNVASYCTFIKSWAQLSYSKLGVAWQIIIAKYKAKTLHHFFFFFTKKKIQIVWNHSYAGEVLT